MEEPRQHYVYVYYRSNGIPLYVGKGFGRRWKKHATAKRPNKHLQNAILKATREGRELRVEKVEEGLTDAEACALEIKLIAEYGRADLKRGPLCNLTDGGDGPFNPSPERRAKIGSRMRGQKHDAQTLAKMSAGQKAYWESITDEERAEIRASRVSSGRYKWTAERRASQPNPMKGRWHSEETKAKIRVARLGKSTGPRSSETREKMRLAMLGKNTGPHTAEHNAKISAGGTGRKRTEQTRAAISAALTGKVRSPEHSAAISAAKRASPKTADAAAAGGRAHKGKPKSPEHIAAIKAAKARKRQERLEKDS